MFEESDVEKPEFSFSTEDQTEDSLVYVVTQIATNRQLKRKISKKDFVNPLTRFEIQDQMTRELSMPVIPGLETINSQEV